MRSDYRQWKLEALDEAGYFIIFQGFLENKKLRDINGNALKLYIYLGVNSNNLDGVVWHSNKKIALYFKKSERTIRLWMNELESLNLIKRMQLKYDGNVVTYLKPYAYKHIDDIDKTSIKIIEGYLHVDEINSLYIKGDNLYIPVTSNMSIELFNNNGGEWVDGKIEIRRLDNSFKHGNPTNEENIKYIFKSYVGNWIVNIEKTQSLKVKVSINEY